MRQRIRRTLNLIGFMLLPVLMIYFSPTASIEGAVEGIIPGSYITFSILFILSLLFGRIFCGWFCPLGGIGDAMGCIHRKNTPGGKLNLIKFGIWIIWISVIIIIAYNSGGYTGIDPFLQTHEGVSLHTLHNYRGFYIVLGTVVLLAAFIGKRAFCHYVCWISPFMIIGRKISTLLKIPRLKLKAGTKQCSNCNKCSSVCPMSLDVEKMVRKNELENFECILCGECVDNCPQKILSYSFTNTK